MGYRPGDTYCGGLSVYASTGGSGPPDSAPVVSTVIHTPNGSTPVEDSTFASALTVSSPLVTNSYNYPIYGTIPSGYSGGDTFFVLMYYTVSSIPIYVPLTSIVIDRLPVIQLNKPLTFPFFMPLSGTNGQTPATGKTVTPKRVLATGGYVNTGGSVTEISNGYYSFGALAADTNSPSGTWEFSAPGCDTQRFPFITQP